MLLAMAERTHHIHVDAPGAPVRVEGVLGLGSAPTLWDELQAQFRSTPRGTRLEIDLSGVSSADGASVALLVAAVSDLRRRGVTAAFTGASGRLAELLAVYEAGGTRPPRLSPRATPILVQVGQSTEVLAVELRRILSFVWELLVAAVGVLTDRRTANWKDVPRLMERSGADAVPIVALINMLVGFVMGFQSASQLKLLGANIYVADLVSISVTRELGPLMTAIILCGRSGAAFAAELGSMAVSEELDALRTMGFDPLRYLVLPRLVAMVIITPLLVLVADTMGLMGGLVAGLTSLDLTPAAYFIEARQALHPADVVTGLIKSVVFGAVITLIACQQGLATTGGAVGVGERTTSSVVTTLFSLILVDAGFTIVFRVVDQWMQ